MEKKGIRFSAEVKERAVRLVLEHAKEYRSRWSAITSVADKIGCSAQTLDGWVKRAEVDRGDRVGVPTEMAERMKTLERENRELRQTNEILRQAIGLRVDSGWLIDEAAVGQIRAATKERLKRFHVEHPLRPGMMREELRGGIASALFAEWLKSDPEIVIEGETVRLASHRVQLQAQESGAQALIEELFAKAGLAVPPVDEVLAQTKLPTAKSRELLQMLLKSRRLVKIADGLMMHHTALSNLKSSMQQKKGQRFQVGAFKEWTGVSRKYAIPLLEWLDRERVTRRDGEFRVVL